jgi:hypothetical protein
MTKHLQMHGNGMKQQVAVSDATSPYCLVPVSDLSVFLAFGVFSFFSSPYILLT